MEISVLNLGISLVFGILYIYSFAKLFGNFIEKISPTKNNALRILFYGALLSAGINLIYIYDSSSASIKFFLSEDNFINAFIYSSGFYIGMWLFSFLFIRGTFFIISMLTPEDEKIELAKNNIDIAILHSISLIILSFLIGPSIAEIASNFIPYPELPFN